MASNPKNFKFILICIYICTLQPPKELFNVRSVELIIHFF